VKLGLLNVIKKGADIQVLRGKKKVQTQASGRNTGKGGGRKPIVGGTSIGDEGGNQTEIEKGG